MPDDTTPPAGQTDSAAGYEPHPSQVTTSAEWVLGARILAAGPFLYYGANHLVTPALLRDMLVVLRVPGADILAMLAPVVELVLGLALIVGIFARFAAGAGAVAALLLFWITWSVITIQQGTLPPPFTVPPPTPSIPMPIVMLVANIIVIIKGAGPCSLDYELTKPAPAPPPDPNEPPLGIV